MGGYVAKAVVVFWSDESAGCFEVYVWHDGELPFGAESKPARLHHCEASQFVRFGEAVMRMQAQAAPPIASTDD